MGVATGTRGVIQGLCKSRQCISTSSGSLHAITMRMVARIFRIEENRLGGPGREQAQVAKARQVAMYLEHVVLGMTFTEVGKLHRRDRTTVAHGCRRIEDWRDERIADLTLAALEHALRLSAQVAR